MWSSSKKTSKVYANASKDKGPEYYDYENYVNLQWGTVQNYACSKKLGRGKYSEVFDSVSLKNSEKCVVKILKPIKSKKINRQIKILQSLGGKNNCIKLLDIVKDDDISCLVFQHVENVDFLSFMSQLTNDDVQYYIYEILKGLDYCHSMGIMHRDIKPQNVMIDHKQKKLRIIDWGLGEFYLPEQDYNVRVSSRYYKGPQLLVGYEFYHYSLDIWSLGVMMAEMVFQVPHIFKGNDNFDQLRQITLTLGTDDLYKYVKNYNIEMDKVYDDLITKQSKKELSSYINKTNEHLATGQALDLLSKMLVYDHNARPTAKQCMEHPYFAKYHNPI